MPFSMYCYHYLLLLFIYCWLLQIIVDYFMKYCILLYCNVDIGCLFWLRQWMTQAFFSVSVCLTVCMCVKLFETENMFICFILRITENLFVVQLWCCWWIFVNLVTLECCFMSITSNLVLHFRTVFFQISYEFIYLYI